MPEINIDFWSSATIRVMAVKDSHRGVNNIYFSLHRPLF